MEQVRRQNAKAKSLSRIFMAEKEMMNTLEVEKDKK